MRDRNRFCYGADESLLAMLNPDDRAEVARNWGYAIVPAREQVARVEDLGRRYDSELVQVQFGPVGVQWASDDLLELVAEASARTGTYSGRPSSNPSGQGPRPQRILRLRLAFLRRR
jgi:hypothetical protein